MFDLVALWITALTCTVALAGVMGAASNRRLKRNRVIGLRAASLQASQEAWVVGHRAGLTTALFGAIVLAATLLVSMMLARADSMTLARVVSCAGLVSLAPTIAIANRRADVAARKLNEDSED